MSYTVKNGDTFELISRKVYGTDSRVKLLRDSNPGAIEPLAEGIILVTPELDAPVILVNSSESNDTTQVFIDGQIFKFWTEISIERVTDGFSQANFTAPFDQDYTQFKNAFKPFSYSQLIIAIDGQFVYFGYLVNVVPSLIENSKSIRIDSYSRASVLSDCMFPIGVESFEFNDVKIDTIAERLCQSIALQPLFDNDVGPKFSKVTVKPEDNAADFLIKIANQRDLILGDNSDGQPVFRKSVVPGNPVQRFVQGESPLVSVVPTFNAQQFYSHITAISPADVSFDGGSYTAANRNLKSVIKPYTFQAAETKGSDIQAAVDAKAGRMYASAAIWEITLNTWRDSGGNIWRENTTVTVLAPDAMIFNEYEFLIRKVALLKTETRESAVLTLTFPESMRGEIPEVLPWVE